MIVDPPFDPAVNATIAAASLAVIAPIVGAFGTVRGVTDTTLDAVPVPSALVAFTEQLYAVPFVRPVTLIGLPAPEAVIDVDEAVQLAM